MLRESLNPGPELENSQGQEATKADASNKVRSLPFSRQDRRMMLHRRDAEQTGQTV
jgi:hypothetical protein